MELKRSPMVRAPRESILGPVVGTVKSLGDLLRPEVKSFSGMSSSE
jgi:hypothetical protein